MTNKPVVIDVPLYHVDLLPSGGLLSAARILADGVRRNLHGWAALAPEVHVGRALTRIQQYINDPEGSEEHLAHAVCRILMACHLVAGAQDTHELQDLWTVRTVLQRAQTELEMDR